ncbi:hypothetical protein C900_01146 [Fulvivirga imtechensis AK7]|uniref:Uncharacterized protein n=1 Tax=Fulvivirga imtechensis AK7 TaxID=1237149 RepID=L8JZY8_9BACT|nr:hypothetical protein [Fulvivirga imtechensis]ELR72767.1 hypothetical protein C900_01146 [Fulvivirga imtechensis AK7]
MAEIDIEKKKSPIWPWLLLGVLVIAALIVLIDDNDDVKRDQVVTQTQEVETAEENNFARQNGEVQAYVSYIEKNGREVGLKHKYSSSALTRLAAALETVASNYDDIEAQNIIEELKKSADELTQNRDSDKHADIMARAFNNAADVMKEIQQKKYPGLEKEIEEVKQAAQAMDPRAMATEQNEKIHKFFTESADALRAMTENV